LADDKPAAEYRAFKQRMTENTVAIGAHYLGGLGDDYPDPNCLFKDDLENPPAAAALDWRITAAPRAEVAKDERCTGSGQSLTHVSYESLWSIT